jgi:phosphatidylserine/phosphatidylglycerophosphate/cardiolipin synthase-like enzyme
LVRKSKSIYSNGPVRCLRCKWHPFVRDPSDALQQKRHFAEALASPRAVVLNVVEVHTTHEKIVVIDDHTVMLGSLNALSQQRSREVMITMTGQHWAGKPLTDLHAEEFSRPPRCGAWKGQQVDLRRVTDSGSWFWRCYNRPARTAAKAGTRRGPAQWS